MNKPGISSLFAISLLASTVQADTVTGEAPDTIAGKGFGGFSGFMIGAVTGGPIGALLGAGIGGFGGGVAQQATGLNGTAYVVEHEDGSETVVRSPNRSWSPGDQVHIVNRRLVSAEDTQ